MNEKTRRRPQTLNRLAPKTVPPNHDFERVSIQGFQDALELLRKAVDFCGASLFTVQPESGFMKCVAEYGEGANFIDRIQFDSGSGLSAWVAQRRRPVHLPNIHRGSRHGQTPIRSYLSMPIYCEEKVVGVLNIAHIVPNAFSRHKFSIIQDFCNRLSHILRVYQRRQTAMSTAAL
jgi:GAF domain-containing protein